MQNQPNAEQQTQRKPQSPLIRTFYPLQNVLKLYFIIASFLLLPYTEFVGLAICIMASLRILKRPQFNKEYLAKLLQNQFGVNLFYILMLFTLSGNKNFLYFAPLCLHFFLGLVQYVNLRHANNPIVIKYKFAIDCVRENKFNIFVAKSKIQFIYFFMILFSLPLNLGQILPLIMFGQYLVLKYKINTEFKYAMYEINITLTRITGKIPPIAFVYNKICGLLNKL